MIQYDTNCLIHVQTVHNKHSEMASSNTFQQIQYLSTKHQLRRQVFKNILAMHRKQMRFHKTKLVDETEDVKEECCEFRKEVCLKVTQCLVVYLHRKTISWYEFQKY